MPALEIIPHAIYTPDQELVIKSDLENLEEPFQGMVLKRIDAFEGVTFSPTDQAPTVSFHIPTALGGELEPKLWSDDSLKINQFLGVIAMLSPSPYEDADHFVASDYHADTLRSTINPSFQVWLNSGGLTSGVRAEAIRAMALPFGKEASRFAKNDNGSGHHSDIDIGQKNRRFTLHRIEKHDASVDEYSAYVSWVVPEFQTAGDCACYTVDGQEHRISFIEWHHRLYDMTPHNLDYSRQALSIVLGLATLLRFASEEPIHPGLLDETDWQHGGKYPTT